MKVEIIEPYIDKQLNKTLLVGEIIEVSEKRAKELVLKKVGKLLIDDSKNANHSSKKIKNNQKR